MLWLLKNFYFIPAIYHFDWLTDVSSLSLLQTLSVRSPWLWFWSCYQLAVWQRAVALNWKSRAGPSLSSSLAGNSSRLTRHLQSLSRTLNRAGPPRHLFLPGQLLHPKPAGRCARPFQWTEGIPTPFFSNGFASEPRKAGSLNTARCLSSVRI